MTRFPVRDKVALVTGGAQGIGLATARELIARGARVALVDLDLERTQDAAASLHDERAIGLQGDVRDRGALQQAVARTVDWAGGLDIVVANAGVVAPASTFLGTPYERFEQVLDVNLHGVSRTIDAALPEVVRRRGHVVIVSSIGAFRNGYGRASYAVSKAAVEQLGDALRVELSAYGMGTTVVYPGLIETDMAVTSEDEELSGVKNRTIPKKLRTLIPASTLATAVVDGVEARRPRVFCPAGWGLRSAIRGVQVPLGEIRKRRDREVHRVVRSLDGTR
jgi:NAD(P)-dependent dehydrogenase (short-subunit alcohol dehydrogenase family)